MILCLVHLERVYISQQRDENIPTEVTEINLFSTEKDFDPLNEISMSHSLLTSASRSQTLAFQNFQLYFRLKNKLKDDLDRCLWYNEWVGFLRQPIHSWTVNPEWNNTPAYYKNTDATNTIMLKIKQFCICFFPVRLLTLVSMSNSVMNIHKAQNTRIIYTIFYVQQTNTASGK